jgi:cell division protein FtsB
MQDQITQSIALYKSGIVKYGIITMQNLKQQLSEALAKIATLTAQNRNLRKKNAEYAKELSDRHE